MQSIRRKRNEVVEAETASGRMSGESRLGHICIRPASQSVYADEKIADERGLVVVKWGPLPGATLHDFQQLFRIPVSELLVIHRSQRYLFEKPAARFVRGVRIIH